MAGAGLAQQRLFCFAALDGFRTARVEPAAGWRLERAGHIPLQNDALALTAGVRHRDGGHQCFGVRMARIAE